MKLVHDTRKRLKKTRRGPEKKWPKITNIVSTTKNTEDLKDIKDINEGESLLVILDAKTQYTNNLNNEGVKQLKSPMRKTKKKQCLQKL